MPIVCVSMMDRNSERSGSGASAATTLIDSNSGRPALMPRTITSTASGSAFRNLASRRLFRKPSAQRGRPKPPAKASPAAPSRPPPMNKASANSTPATTADTIQNFCGAQSRPACDRRTLSGTLFSCWRRASRSLSEVSTCSRRERCVFSAGGGGGGRAPRSGGGRGRLGPRDRGAAALGLPFPGQHWIKEDPGEAADGGGGKEGEGKDLHVHGCVDLLTSWAPLPPRRAPRQGASLRRNSGRVPRI